MIKNIKLTYSARVCILCLAVISVLVGCNGNKQEAAETSSQLAVASTNIGIWPKLDIAVKADADIEEKVASLLATMTLEQKVAQMIQPEIRDITVEDMRKYGFGSYLNGGGAFPNNDKHATPSDWVNLAEAMYQASIDDSLDGNSIPTMWGTDAVHGHNNVIGATLFPHNIALGATNNPDLIEKIAAITATEVMVTGIDWVFAPTVAVVRDDRWGRTYEGYSEDPEIVREYSAAIVKGLQGAADKDFLGDNRVISTIKHFIGDGGTEGGDDQGNNLSSEPELFDIHAQGYVGGLTAGAQSVMASFNSWHGSKIHGNKYLITDVLKGKMGFDGFVVGDWNGHGQVKGCSNESCAQAINAGLDIFMVPTDAWKPLYENTIAQANSGEIAQTRIDDAVSRILRVKFRAGLFDKPSPVNRALSGKIHLIGAIEHREVARQAVRESLVLLKNKGNILPLSAQQNILVAGDGADNIGKQSGGWTITWQGTNNFNNDFPGGSSIYQGIEQQVKAQGGSVELNVDGHYKNKPDVAIVVFGEEPYAEGVGDIENLEYQQGVKQDLALLKRLKADGIKVVSLFISGRPLWVNAELNASDAFVVVWLPGSEGVAVADVLFSKENGDFNYDFTGNLSYSWPATASQTKVNRFDEDYQPLLPYGFGLNYGEPNVLADDLNVINENTTESLASITLFESSVKSPWKMMISDSHATSTMTSSIIENKALYLRSIDRDVQEDARRALFNGSEKGQLAFTSSSATDLSPYGEANSTLELTVRLTERQNLAEQQGVYLAMLCGEQCQGKVNITKQLSLLEVNQWHTLNIDLNCFVKSGADLSSILSPFSLQTAAPLNIDFTDIYIRPDNLEQATISCQ
ncbi:MAG: exo 1,3/1,4-beta-D-glucan glucohydrolase [Colwellia sp.]|uniref:glycoside hydrolase family 3 protein n=1 Tax=Colwellia sp. TaxID=56799 RepID=UPI001D24A068|nr:exo 1,3/1,4-beta-D-glucan glucohydrolase [Colwellia sp.]NQY48904.1 exo 1,3/1,4-beta-D-glucan glucohydrolase [Colwellia sp.]